MTSVRYIYCSDNVLDWQNVDVLSATKECLDLRIGGQTPQGQPQVEEEPPLQRKKTKDMVPSVKTSPVKRGMDSEAN